MTNKVGNKQEKIVTNSKGENEIKIIFAEKDNVEVLDIVLEILMSSYEDRIGCEKMQNKIWLA